VIFWLDWKLFGNGRGMASPYFDDVFYWLSGRFYQFTGGFGSQLASYEWRIPTPGTRRHLMGEDFIVYSAKRRWLRVAVSWTRARPTVDVEDIRLLEQKIKNWGHGTARCIEKD